ncbi:MAG: sigma-70 family RNA polymerase sigma factor [Planctomycetes bacterium]|nr:sigma-70 family RNA polymerase sigma factor [Planctomycetota bacterium]
MTTAIQDDRDLAQRAQAGDHAAFNSLVEAYSSRIFNMLLQLCNGDRDMASELTQEAFVRAYERLDSFAGESKFYTWLYRLARNRAIDVLKRKRPMSSDPHKLDVGSSTIDPSADLERSELQAQVQSALAQLKDEQREIILLRDFDGHDYQEIATLLDIAPGTVKSRLNRARKSLREILSPFMQQQSGGTS